MLKLPHTAVQFFRSGDEYGLPLSLGFYLSNPFLGLALSFRPCFVSLELRIRSSATRTLSVTLTFAVLRGWPLFETAEQTWPTAADPEAGVF